MKGKSNRTELTATIIDDYFHSSSQYLLALIACNSTTTRKIYTEMHTDTHISMKVDARMDCNRKTDRPVDYHLLIITKTKSIEQKNNVFVVDTVPFYDQIIDFCACEELLVLLTKAMNVDFLIGSFVSLKFQ
jgi:hypothetical protein